MGELWKSWSSNGTGSGPPEEHLLMVNKGNLLCDSFYNFVTKLQTTCTFLWRCYICYCIMPHWKEILAHELKVAVSNSKSLYYQSDRTFVKYTIVFKSILCCGQDEVSMMECRHGMFAVNKLHSHWFRIPLTHSPLPWTLRASQ
jgi:hypothetical protein